MNKEHFINFIRGIDFISEGETARYRRSSTSDNEDRWELHILQPDGTGKHNDCLVCSNCKLPG